MTHYRSLFRVIVCVSAGIVYPRSAVVATTSAYEAGELIVLFDSTAHSVIEAALTASRANQTVIGVADFDSIGSVHQLQIIQASPQADASEFSRRFYVLVFPANADVVAIAAVYSQLPYVASAEPNYTVQVTGATAADSGADPSAVLATPPDPSVFKSRELIVLFAADSTAAIEATLQASRASQTTIGIAVLDSVGVVHQLQTITASPGANGGVFSRRLYIFTFPEDADIAAISLAYAILPHVASAEPNFIVRATAVLVETGGTVLQGLTLGQNHPNPFNQVTTIQFRLSFPQEIELVVHNLSGQKVATLAIGSRGAGAHTFRWDGRDDNRRAVASGVYVYRLVAERAGVLTEKMLLLR